MESFCAESKRGVELALDGGDGALLPIVSEGVSTLKEVSFWVFRPAWMALSKQKRATAVDFCLLFEIRLLPITVAVGVSRSERQAQCETLEIL